VFLPSSRNTQLFRCARNNAFSPTIGYSGTSYVRLQFQHDFKNSCMSNQNIVHDDLGYCILLYEKSVVFVASGSAKER
jgi:hypothetical protein